MALTILVAVSALGILPALLKRGWTMYGLIALFLIVDAALLAKVESDIAAVSDPGPDARAVAALFFIPSIAFVVAGSMRLLVEFVKYVQRKA